MAKGVTITIKQLVLRRVNSSEVNSTACSASEQHCVHRLMLITALKQASVVGGCLQNQTQDIQMKTIAIAIKTCQHRIDSEYFCLEPCNIGLLLLVT